MSLEAPLLIAAMAIAAPRAVRWAALCGVISVLDYSKGFGHTDLVRC